MIHATANGIAVTPGDLKKTPTPHPARRNLCFLESVHGAHSFEEDSGDPPGSKLGTLDVTARNCALLSNH